MPFSQPIRPVGAGFGFLAAESAATALPAQMTPIISATNPLRSISAPPWNPRIVRWSASAAGRQNNLNTPICSDFECSCRFTLNPSALRQVSASHTSPAQSPAVVRNRKYSRHSSCSTSVDHADESFRTGGMNEMGIRTDRLGRVFSIQKNTAIELFYPIYPS